MSKYDVVIIGSGLGGLSCGVILSKEGYKVCILEQSHSIGGCLQSFTRYGVNLDTGIHYVGGVGEGEILNKYFKYFEILDSLSIQKLDDKCFDEIHFGDKKYCYSSGYDNFYRTMLDYFPHESIGLRKYLDTIKLIGEQVSVADFKRGILPVGSLDYLSVSASDFIESCTDNIELQNVLAGTVLQYGGIKGESTLYHHAMINHTNIGGAYRFVGGTQQIADSMVAVIKKSGGTVLTNSKVVSVNILDNKIGGVTLENGEVIKGTEFISSTHPAQLFNMLDKTPLIKKAYISRLNIIPNTYGAFSVYLIMKDNSFEYFNKNYYFYKGSDAWKSFPCDDFSPEVLLLSCQAQSFNQKYSKVLTIMCPIEFSHFKKWEDTSCNKRGDDYIEFKNIISGKLIDFICEKIPNIRDNIERIVSTTPLSYRDYTSTKEGSIYGLHKNSNSPLTTLIGVRTKIPNLFLTGQSLNVHGAIGVVMTATLTCEEILGTNSIIKKIGNA